MKLIGIALLAAALSASAFAGQKKGKAKITEAQATQTVLQTVKGGTIQSAELEKEEGKLVWSFDVKTEKGLFELWVDATTGKVIKTENESVSEEEAEMVTEAAEKAALKKVPGEVTESTVKTEKGKKIYSIEIKTKKGKTVEVDVDAITNKVLRMETEETKEDEDEDSE